jgi:hypothetical protein
VKVPANDIHEGDFLYEDNLFVAHADTVGGVVHVFDPFGAHVSYSYTDQVEVADRD